ncbi:MAG: hypothetical protein M5U34_37305 [Chloroflexi bacterium]|nr:hypothetical protein [Chloroflexota bacterium]
MQSAPTLGYYHFKFDRLQAEAETPPPNWHEKRDWNNIYQAQGMYSPSCSQPDIPAHTENGRSRLGTAVFCNQL